MKITRLLSFTLIFLFIQVSTFPQNNPVSLSKMSKEADVIFTGKVLTQKSSWNKNKSRIYTDVTLEVNDCIKGQNSEKTIVVRHPGGEVGEVGELYSHMPKFYADEEVLLFVKKDTNSDEYRVSDGENGKIQIKENKATGEKITALNKKMSVVRGEIKKYLQK